MHSHAHHGHSLNKAAFSATMHCFTGCATGEVLGLAIGAAYGLSNVHTILLAVFLAFVFGYALTLIPLLKHMTFKAALGAALVTDTLSITVMEITDNALMLVIPGAMDAPLTSGLFWASLSVSLAVAFVAAYPVNRHLISKGIGRHVH